MKLFNKILGYNTGVLLFAVLLIYVSCVTESSAVDPLTNIQKLQGKWRVNSAEEFEEWYPADDYPFTGLVYSGDGKEKESLSIEKEGVDIIYKAKVFNQNGGKKIGFKLIKCNKDELTFQNKEHDFPNTISYRFKNYNNIEAVISGMRNQQPIEMTLKFESVQ